MIGVSESGGGRLGRSGVALVALVLFLLAGSVHRHAASDTRGSVVRDVATASQERSPAPCPVCRALQGPVPLPDAPLEVTRPPSVGLPLCTVRGGVPVNIARLVHSPRAPPPTASVLG